MPDKDEKLKVCFSRNVKINMGNYESQDIMASVTVTSDTEIDDDSIKEELKRVTSIVEGHIAEVMDDNGLDFIANLNKDE